MQSEDRFPAARYINSTAEVRIAAWLLWEAICCIPDAWELFEAYNEATERERRSVYPRLDD